MTFDTWRTTPPTDDATPEPCEYCGGVVECAARCETRRCSDCERLVCVCEPLDFDEVYQGGADLDEEAA
jgi:hypothetical protein